MVETRRSLKSIHDAAEQTINGSGSSEDPYTTENSENSYIGIFALVESVLQQKPVIIEVSGVKVRVDKNEFSYLSGESTREFRTKEDVIATLKSPTNYFFEKVSELAQQS
jgi:hypothetical protein